MADLNATAARLLLDGFCAYGWTAERLSSFESDVVLSLKEHYDQRTEQNSLSQYENAFRSSGNSNNSGLLIVGAFVCIMLTIASLTQST